MSVIAPSSDIVLCRVPLKYGSPHQLKFKTKQEQTVYFDGLTDYVTVEKATFVREKSVLRIPRGIDDIRHLNYCYYRNRAHGNRRFYCFVTNMEYASDEVTLVTIETDYYQTYQFDYTLQPCFVERETVSDDSIGAHTVPEGLNLGEFVTNGSFNRIPICSVGDGATIIGVTEIDFLPNNEQYMQNVTLKTIYGGVNSGIYLLAVQPRASESLIALINAYDKAGKSSSILFMYVYPWTALENYRYQSGVLDNAGHRFYNVGSMVGDLPATNTTIPRPTAINDYNPKNNKLFTYPYCYLLCDNNNGGTSVYHYEDFGSNIVFSLGLSMGIGCPSRLYPQNYKMTNGANYQYGLTGGKLPTAAWASDAYTNWLTQNAVSIENTNLTAGITTMGAIGSGAIAVATGGAAAGLSAAAIALGAGTNVLNQIAELNNEDYKASLVPPQAKGDVASGDLTFASGRAEFTVIPMSIKAENARIIDDYFSMFGYKVNRLKAANLDSRENWNYIKTVGAIVTGQIPNEAAEALRDMFDSGITFWHKPNNFLNYSLSNAII